MRLRPSGNAGPVATTAANFARYHAETAQIWEQQALTRARVVAGDPALAERVEAGDLGQPRAAARRRRARPGDPRHARAHLQGARQRATRGT